MINFSDGLSVVGIFDAGVANLERIVLRAEQPVDLAGYLILLALRGQSGGGSLPLRDNMLWLGNTSIDVGDWVYVYTGPGEAQTSVLPNNPNRVVSMYWGKNQTIFQGTHLTAALVKIEHVQYPAYSSQFALGQQQGGYPILGSS